MKFNIKINIIKNKKMKLFSEKLTKLKFSLLLAFSVLEIICFIILFISYRPLYLKVFDQAKEASINKTISITHTLNEILKLSLNECLLDLKLAGKHMSFLAYNSINNNSQYYNNLINNKDKHIFFGTTEELKKNFSDYYDENENKFLFHEKYIKDYVENNSNQINILNYLMDKEKHPELNSISYFKEKGNINDIKDNETKKLFAKYLLSILKTNYIKRFVIRGSDFEINHYFMLTKEELYFYPPESFEKSSAYKLKNIYNCHNNITECLYNTIINKMENISKNQNIKEKKRFPFVPITYINFENITNILCLNIPFEKKLIFDNNDSDELLICMEINMEKIFHKNMFGTKEGFNFILFIDNEGDKIPIYTDHTEIFEEIKKVFTNSKFKKYSLNSDYHRYFDHFDFFQFLYIDLFKEPSLLEKYEISLDDIFDEYNIIEKKILDEVNKFNITGDDYITLDIQKTTCNSDIYYNGQKCSKDNFMLIIHPLKSNFHPINNFFIDETDIQINQILFYSMSIISNNYKYMKWKINQIIVIKIIKLFIFYFFSSLCFILLYFIFVQFFYDNKYNSINQILNIIKDGSFFDIKDKNELIQKKQEINIDTNNKDMTEIKNLFDYLVKTMLLKINFELNENNVNKKEINIDKKNKNLKSTSSVNTKNNALNKNNIDNLNEYMDIIKNKNDNEIWIMFAFIISYNHFRRGLYKLSENEFKNLIIEVNKYLHKLSDKNEYNDSKLKDSISRCSKISYLNEYSLTNELSENTLPIIKVKLMIQKIYYLLALSIFNQEKLKSNSDKKYNKEKTKLRIEEAIKYFDECKNISILLGTDTIRQIFSLIMISKCYIELKNYKESMLNINEALLLYSDLQKAFKDKPYFNPKIMMFTENYIFQNIMLSMAQITYSFNKYPQSCWILMKMIETSPFVFNSVHFQACLYLYNCLSQIESSYNLPLRQIDKYKKKINKMLARINVRLYNKEKKGNIDSRYTNNNLTSAPSTTNSHINNLSFSIENFGINSNFKKLTKSKEMVANKFSMSINSVNHFLKNRYKTITLCISEKVIAEINGDELKDVIIKFFKKCFSNGIEEDKFSFIQFSCNGKKTISIKTDSLEIFLQKLEVNKMAFKINEAYTKNNDRIQFMEFSNLFLNIIKSYKQTNYDDRVDNIIIIFINTSDIRFNGQKECVDTINELNNNNYSVIIFTYDIEIDEEKIEGIYSFVYGLNDGHFIQVKNYQQIKQILMNFCIKDSQEKFHNYNYEINDYIL